MPDEFQNHDIIAVRKDSAFDICEFMNGALNRLEGPYGQPDAERRARHLARERGSDAWIQEFPTAVRLLQD